MKDVIAIIGAGNMGGAFYSGLRGKSRLRINVCDRNKEKLSALDAEYAFTDAAKAIEGVSAVLIAVKPQSARELLTPLGQLLKDRLVISVMAGVTLSSLVKMTRSDRVIRAMPNLPASIRKGLTGWVATPETRDNDRTFAKELFYAVGEEIEVENEATLDALTPLTGSGPAYFFLLAEMIAAKAVKEGFSEKEAALMARETLIGSARLLETDSRTPAQWREAVTSKGGVTQAALQVLKDKKIDEVFFEAVDHGKKRSQELSQ